MCSDIAIKVENLSKCYQIYDTPRDRLKQFVLPRLQNTLGKTPQQYYREFWALKDVSLEIKRGESVGILGRNGSGKSTLLQIICGTLAPSTGQVEVNGRIAALLELGSGFNPEFTGRENIYLNGTLLGLTKEQIDRKFDAIAAFADVGPFIDQPVKIYSSGMVVRLAFSVQVQVEPDILVVDEALAVGDALFQKRCFQRMEKLLSAGTTLLFVSHDIESIRTLTHKALLLNKGVSKNWGLSSDIVLEYRRLLHKEESLYFSELTKQKKKKSNPAPPHTINNHPADSKLPHACEDAAASVRSDRLSFGEGGVQIVSVKTLNEKGESTNIFYPGDSITIRVIASASMDVNNLNIAVRIRNKEGIKIYSWGTLNQDMEILSNDGNAPIFWKKNITLGERIEVDFEMPCNLGQNLYEIQAAVSHEKTPNYLNQTMLHWRDEAAFFQVMMRREEYFFGGVIDLRMKANWKVQP